MKRNALVLSNIILVVFFLYLLLGSTYIVVEGENIFYILKSLWGNIVILLFLILNCTIIYKLLLKKEQKNLRKYAMWTLSIVVGFLVLFAIGMMLATSEAPKEPIPKEIFRLQIIK